MGAMSRAVIWGDCYKRRLEEVAEAKVIFKERKYGYDHGRLQSRLPTRMFSFNSR
jgi:hypothetical protein